MKEQIEEILNQYIQDMIKFQPEYEYGCYERGLYPKSLYERTYNALHNMEWMEQYCEERGVDTSNYNKFYEVFVEVRDSIKIPEDTETDD